MVTDQRKRGCNYYAQPGRRPLLLKRTKQIFTLTEVSRLVGTALDLVSSSTMPLDTVGDALNPPGLMIGSSSESSLISWWSKTCTCEEGGGQ